jgi:hypothetical protein
VDHTRFYSKANIDINGPRARVFLNTSGEDMLNGGYIDSGTIHHMTRHRELFSNLDTSVHGLVQSSNAPGWRYKALA